MSKNTIILFMGIAIVALLMWKKPCVTSTIQFDAGTGGGPGGL